MTPEIDNLITTLEKHISRFGVAKSIKLNLTTLSCKPQILLEELEVLLQRRKPRTK